MEIFGWIAVVVGVALYIVGFLWMVRANAGARIPYLRTASANPGGAILLRSIGVGLLVIGGAALAPTLGYGIIPIVFLLPLVAMPAGIALHNQRQEPDTSRG